LKHDIIYTIIIVVVEMMALRKHAFRSAMILDLKASFLRLTGTSKRWHKQEGVTIWL